MQQFDPSQWGDIPLNKSLDVPNGRLEVNTSEPCTLYIKQFGFSEVVHSHATSFRVLLPMGCTYKIVGKKGATASTRMISKQTYQPEGTIYTNIDRQPEESGILSEVRKTLRMHAFEQQGILTDIKARQRALEEATLKQAEKAETKPEPKPEPEAKKEPEAKPKTPDPAHEGEKAATALDE